MHIFIILRVNNAVKTRLALLIFCLLFSNFLFAQTYTTPGTTTLTVPAGTTSVIIECLGAGGGGGGGSSNDAAGGGGGGAYSKSVAVVSPGQILTITVGAGGRAGNNLSPLSPSGENGGTSSVTCGSILCSAQGGFGGAGSNGGGAVLGGGGGASGVGFLYKGGNGGNGYIASYNSGGGGGGAAGSTSNGNNGANGPGTSAAAAGGTAGTGGFGSGNGGAGCSTWTSCSGTNGANYGGGGGGAGAYSANRWGGTGAGGKVVILFCSLNFTTQPQTAAQNLCVGSVPTTLTVSATGTPTYQWYSNTVASNSGGTLIAGATSTSYTPPTTSVGITYYYCVATSGGCVSTSAVSGGVFVGKASILLNTASNLLCGGGSVTLTAAAAGATNYLWSPGGATTPSITVSPTSNTSYTVSVTGTCSSSNSMLIKYSPPLSFSATATSDNLNGYTSYTQDILYLNAYPIQNTLTPPSEGFNGGFGAWTPSTSGTATNAGCTAMPSVTVIANEPNYYVGALPITNIYPFEGSGMVMFNSRYTAAGNLGFVTSPSFSTVGYTGMIVDFYFMQFVNSACGAMMQLEYSIDGGSVWTTLSPNYMQSGSTAQCPSWMNFSTEMPAGFLNQANAKIRFKFTSSGNSGCGQDMLLDKVRVTGVTVAGGYSFYSNYAWTESGTGPPLAIVNSAIRSTTTADLNDQTSSGYLNFDVRLTDQNGCVYSASDVVNINPAFNGGTSGTAVANPTIVCPGGSSLLSFTPSSLAPASLQWQQSTTSATAGYTNIAGATSANYTATNITQTTWYRVNLGNSGEAMSGSCLGAMRSIEAMVTVPTFTNGTVQNTGQSLCVGEDPAPISFTNLPSGSGTITYQWYSYNGTTTVPSSPPPSTGWTSVGASGSGTITTTTITRNFNASLPAGWVNGGVLGATCGGLASNAVNLNSTGLTLTSETFPSAVTSISFVFGAKANSCGFACVQNPRTAEILLEAFNGTAWTTVATITQGTVQNQCNSATRSYSFSASLNYTQFRITRTANTTATTVSIDDFTANMTSVPTYDPPAGITGNTTYAAVITFTGGLGGCGSTAWAAQEWVATTDGCVLPIELVDFSAHAKENGISLNWTTATELNNARFEVERSLNEKDFDVILKTPSKALDGNSFQPLYYSEWDKNIELEKWYYYRLKQVDIDGNYGYSKIISARINTGSEIFLVPNPAKENVTIVFKNDENSDGMIQVYDTQGKLCLQKNITCNGGQNSIELDVSALSLGLYYVSLSTNNEIRGSKLMKTR